MKCLALVTMFLVACAAPAAPHAVSMPDAGLVVASADAGTALAAPAVPPCLQVREFVAAAPDAPTTAPTFRDLAAGWQRTCGITSAGEVFCWGGNLWSGFEAAEQGRAERIAMPARFDPLEVAVGAGGGCARGRGGRVACWGDMAPGAPMDLRAARLLPRVVDAIDLAVDDRGACAATRVGEVWCWGEGTFRVLDFDPPPDMPTRIRGVSHAVQIEVGGDIACARGSDRKVTCWGNYNPPRRLDGVDDAIDVAVHGKRACVVRSSGKVGCQDDVVPLPDALSLHPFEGHTGRPAGQRIPPPPPEPAPDVTDAVDLAMGHGFMCARSAAGLITCTGPKAPEAHPAPGIVATQLSAALDVACIRDDQGTGWCWGADQNRALGAWQRMTSARPLPICGVDKAVEISAADGFTCFRQPDGVVGCAGINTAQQVMGGPSSVASAAPHPGGLATSVSAGARHRCQVSRLGRAFCHGRPDSEPDAQKGNYAIPIGSGEPKVENVVEVAAGGSRDCARVADGRVVCWQIIPSDSIRAPWRDSQPVFVPGVEAAIRIVATPDGGCALEPGGRVSCWGRDIVPQSKSTDAWYVDHRLELGPRVIWTDVRLLAAGTGGACAVLADGEVRCRAQQPLAVPAKLAARGARSIGVGDGRACLVNGDGTVSCWTLAAAAPVLERVPDLDDATFVTVGVGHACALRENGRPVCWGRNELGQLGTGPEPQSDRAVRVQVAFPER